MTLRQALLQKYVSPALIGLWEKANSKKVGEPKSGSLFWLVFFLTTSLVCLSALIFTKSEEVSAKAIALILGAAFLLFAIWAGADLLDDILKTRECINDCIKLNNISKKVGFMSANELQSFADNHLTGWIFEKNRLERNGEFALANQQMEHFKREFLIFVKFGFADSTIGWGPYFDRAKSLMCNPAPETTGTTEVAPVLVEA